MKKLIKYFSLIALSLLINPYSRAGGLVSCQVLIIIWNIPAYFLALASLVLSN